MRSASFRAASFSGFRVSSPQHRPTLPILPQTVHCHCVSPSAANHALERTALALSFFVLSIVFFRRVSRSALRYF
jgi:hypothetical protein